MLPIKSSCQYHIRWISNTYEANEDFIGLVYVPTTTTASTLTIATKDVLIRCALPLAQCRGQAYRVTSAVLLHRYRQKKQLQSVFIALYIVLTSAYRMLRAFLSEMLILLWKFVN